MTIAIFLAGCANHFGVSGADYKLGSAPQGEGLVVFSSRFVLCDNVSTVVPMLHFATGDSLPANSFTRIEKGDPQFWAALYNPLLPYHFENPPGYLYVFSKPAGDYVAKDLDEQGHQTPIAQQASFRVRAGKVTYAGEITVKECRYDSATVKVTLSAANQWESRDRALFAERLPNVDSKAVVIDLMKLQ